MSEEQVVEAPAAEEQQGPPIEDVAREMGWNPEHDGPDKIDAAEFVRRKPLFDKIKQQSKELKDIKRMVEKITTTHKQISEAQYRRGITDAERRMKAAKDTLDVDGFQAAMNDKVALEQAVVAQNMQAELPPEVAEWCERNKWFDTDTVMQADALEYRERFVRLNPNAHIKDVLAYVEKKIKKEYPEAFEEAKPEVKKPTAPAVETGGSDGGKSDPFAKLKSSMSAEEKRIMKMFIGPGKMTEAEYLKDYAAVRGEK